MKKLYNPFPGKFLLFVFLLAASASASAQNISVTFRAVNNKKEPLAFASVTVINRNDSLKTITKVADSNGTAKFSLEKRNQYTVRNSSVD